MNVHTYLPKDEMIRRALDTLLATLGPVETTRFLALPQQERLNSVQRHRQWQDRLNKDQFFDQVFGPEEYSAA
ncbi:MAG: hypothetical protein U9R15_15510 [Chloroflexota bacterium]|nr:hypothetical protein [Chloroflexota bacterium]